MSKKKDVSMLVSALGVLMGIITALVAAVKKKGGTDENFYRLATPEGESLIEKIADLIVQAGRKADNIFSVSVNYDRSVANAIEAGKYDWVNDDFTSGQFPTKRSGTAVLDIQLVHFNKDTITDEVLAELDKKDLRPAELHELLALGEKFPDLQKEFSIIALGSVWRSWAGDHYCPYLSGSGPERECILGWIGNWWLGSCRFAAVRK